LAAFGSGFGFGFFGFGFGFWLVILEVVILEAKRRVARTWVCLTFCGSGRWFWLAGFGCGFWLLGKGPKTGSEDPPTPSLPHGAYAVKGPQALKPLTASLCVAV
jgi:hypothetical protein